MPHAGALGQAMHDSLTSYLFHSPRSCAFCCCSQVLPRLLGMGRRWLRPHRTRQRPPRAAPRRRSRPALSRRPRRRRTAPGRIRSRDPCPAAACCCTWAVRAASWVPCGCTSRDAAWVGPTRCGVRAGGGRSATADSPVCSSTCRQSTRLEASHRGSGHRSRGCWWWCAVAGRLGGGRGRRRGGGGG